MNKENAVDYFLLVAILLAAIFASVALMFAVGSNEVKKEVSQNEVDATEFVLPVRWGDLGMKMLSVGLIDEGKFENIYKSQSVYPEVMELLYSDKNENLVMTEENSAMLLNVLWALGLGNKNEILDSGPMNDKKYGGAGNFAATAGWTLAKGHPMDHYSRHPFMMLTPEQQALVERVSKGIYRPCCDGPTHFPDCNHGMAMLGLLELMASQGISEEEMYRVALRVNSFWFPDTYKTAELYFKSKGIEWNNVDPKEVLGKTFSSASGYRNIKKQILVPQNSGGGSCSV